MTAPSFDAVQVGDTLPVLTLPAISRKTLALYAGASADHHPLHIDLDYARDAGMKDVFAHGMLSAAYVGRLLTSWVPQECIRSLSMRFSGITQLYDVPTTSGRVIEKFEQDGEKRAKLALKCTNQHGEEKIVGEAVVALA
ncbi:MaoC/PaaZ C-terminal domain-containing protein [Variovorax robiniae]|uniref:MaoC/PaaZ C-terminal domain-containing protein n=1 Tax=Variovorax robiniae TaxID=1836199 RepID=A0ABU8XFY4_9BURK